MSDTNFKSKRCMPQTLSGSTGWHKSQMEALLYTSLQSFGCKSDATILCYLHDVYHLLNVHHGTWSSSVQASKELHKAHELCHPAEHSV